MDNFEGDALRAIFRAPGIRTDTGGRQDQLLLEAHEPRCAGFRR